jgi:hypothetical protein
MDRQVNCPFCGDVLTLGRLPIVATNVRRARRFGEAASDDEGPTPVSGSSVLRVVGDWPVVAEPPLPPDPQPKRGWFKSPPSLPRLTQSAAPEDLPARLCTSCKQPLPADIDDHDVVTVAVVGVNGASKTHYLASALTEASHRQQLQMIGCEVFEPDEATGERFHQDFHAPLFRHRNALMATLPDEEVVRKPLGFRASFDNGRSVLLLFHDVAGEVLRDRSQRAAAAPFVRRADAIIFLIDPRWLDDRIAAASTVSRFGEQPPEDPGFNQADLLTAIIRELGDRKDVVPVAVTVAKSDLLGIALQRQFRFLDPAPTEYDAWTRDLPVVGQEVHQLLQELGGRALVAAADRLPLVSYHAVAAVGSQPDGANQVATVRPTRCLDPLAAVLLRIPGLVR